MAPQVNKIGAQRLPFSAATVKPEYIKVQRA
jgi:hypothetical protein